MESFYLLRFLESRNLSPILKWLSGDIERQWQTVKRFVHAWKIYEKGEGRPPNSGTPIQIQRARDDQLRVSLMDERGREVTRTISPEGILVTVLGLLHHLTVPDHEADT